MTKLHQLLAALIACLAATAAAADTLPLRHGSYVSGYDGPCKEAPFASVSDYDGHGFGDPHNSRCTMKILRHAGNQYRVSNICRAEGDGTPLASPGRETLNIVVNSPTSYTATMGIGKNRSTYVSTFCPGY